LQPNTLQHNLSANVLNVNSFQQQQQTGNQLLPSQLMNRRPSSSTAIVTTSSNRFLTQSTLSVSGQIGTQLNTNSLSTSAINQTDHLSSSVNHLSNLDPMTNYGGSELIKTNSVNLTTTNSMTKQQFLDVNNNSSYNNLRRKSSSALSNAPKFNRTLSLRSSIGGELEQQLQQQQQQLIQQQQQQQQQQQTNINNPVEQQLRQQQQFQQQQTNLTNINNQIEQQQLHQIQLPQQQQTNQSISIQNQMQQSISTSTIQNQLTNRLQTNQVTDYKLTRQPSIQMRSPIMKSISDLDKQTQQQQQQQQQYTSTSNSISSIIATPVRRPSSQTTNQMQPRCISALALRNRPLSISANSCSSSDEAITDTESLCKAGTTNSKHEVIGGNNGKLIGEIRLSIVMSKGLLELEILEAKLDSTKLQQPNNPNSKPGKLVNFFSS
jgi:hypothetical protein